MKLEEFQNQFQAYTERAKKFPEKSKTLNELQKQITEISWEAAKLYYDYSDPKEVAYQKKIQIFLEFDEMLKAMKREFQAQTAEKKKNSFFSAKSPVNQALLYDSAFAREQPKTC